MTSSCWKKVDDPVSCRGGDLVASGTGISLEEPFPVEKGQISG